MPPNQYADVSDQGLRVAIIGQSDFAVDVMERLIRNGHCVVGVFTIPDKGQKKQDPLAKAGDEYNIPVFKYSGWRRDKKLKPEIMTDYEKLNVELNVLAFCSQYIPMEIINYPRFQSICYHPSILPRHRGASAINWTLITGDEYAGFSIFWPDDGLDTGPILLQDRIKIEETDNVDSLYKRFLYPAGISALEKAVDMIADGTAPKEIQNETLATYDPMLNKQEYRKIDFNKSSKELYNFIRGMDSVPGASCAIKIPGTNHFEIVDVFGSSIWKKKLPINAKPVEIESAKKPALLHSQGLLLFTNDDDVAVNITRVKINGKFRAAESLDQLTKQIEIEYSEDEKESLESLRKIWESILNVDVNENTDFFLSGAGSMDVVRLVEEVKELFKIEFENAQVFMASSFEEFCQEVVKTTRSGGFDNNIKVNYKGKEIFTNGITINIPTQMFINGEFVDAETGKTSNCINPTDESVICQIPAATINDVNQAVEAAKKAFEEGEWSKISARERGLILFRLADLMQEHKEELATIEALDAGAVYTLALKTHVGMSIETWRYFAGWADKIHGSTVPISNARPNSNLCFTKKDAIGVCGLVTPWNYPLMMLSWKMAACLAAGNTVVIKPAQVCPLTALKFAELSVKAGVPPGVINVVTGSGTIVGNAIASHPDVRKLGFTGSTEIGKVIMKTCAENVKKVSLELGGKSPLIIFGDCDIEKAVKLGMQSVFFNKGENCIAAGRIFVENSIYKEFIHRVAKETKKITIGDPLNKSTAHGPQNHLAHLEKLIEYVDLAVKEGARLIHGGKRVKRSGYFFEPTILADIEDEMFVAKEESFGPIMCISKFDDGDIDGVIKRANATEYGLASGVFTSDINKALKIAEKIEAGTVFINTYNKTDVAAPFGGFKQSGFGKDLGQEALNEYLKTKCVTIEY
nr:cytosolic 10-formyltetrahydrofolate dehydrogenase [Onthophagus taurus]